MASFEIIQGGMGVGVSCWTLARAVAQCGELGVVSGTGLAAVMARRLQLGDAQGHLRRAIGAFPSQGLAQRVLSRYWRPAAKDLTDSFLLSPMPTIQNVQAFVELTVLANFVEVYLAKEGHNGLVGVNFLEKVQIPNAPSLLGAMLAGVDYVLMGAGIPRYIPGLLDELARGGAAELRIEVEGAASGASHQVRVTLSDLGLEHVGALKRPAFLGIISSSTLALTLAKKSNGRVDGFIIEGATAGGHNAPPRGPLSLNARGEPIYGPRDQVDLAKIRDIGLPFWNAGGYATPEKLAEARAQGAAGIQVGTAFAFCRESGIQTHLKEKVLQLPFRDVFTDPLASPTGFPLKVLQVPGTLSEPEVYSQRTRICDMGYLRHPYLRDDGAVGYRCPAEPVEHYLKKGGRVEETQGRKCLCNALFSTIGLAQTQSDGSVELPLITAGDDAADLTRFLAPGQSSYSAADVIAYLLGKPQA